MGGGRAQVVVRVGEFAEGGEVAEEPGGGGGAVAVAVVGGGLDKYGFGGDVVVTLVYIVSFLLLWGL